MKKMLIVEDQAEIRRLIRWALEYEDFALEEASDGESGLVVARRFRPDVVLLDVMMPGALDGLAVCRELKSDAEFGYPVVVMLTARAQVRDEHAGIAAGADAYLGKPFSPLELIENVQRLLERRATA